MKVEVINPHGFCAGVKSALAKVEGLRDVYCLHQLVHNEIVIGRLKERGFRFVETLEDVPEGSRVVFSAHGVSPAVREAAKRRSLDVIDATCPFVAKVHRAVADFAAKGLAVVVVGRRGHAEVEGIVGEAENVYVYPNLPEARRIGVVSQTTLNSDEVADIVAELSGKYEVETMAEVCYATKERQDAVRSFKGDALLVLGSPGSSNTRRLCEVAPCRAFMAATLDEIRAIDFSSVGVLGVTSGASTPESFFDDALSLLKYGIIGEISNKQTVSNIE
jgi:4-hydroxy-3-methylbut-2-enyl diphosphate reductase